ncbi:hypothetical protein EJ02DRAFT_464221 [Clathrospora elynae]|uniref:Uncharacterized protein n=1 Tax=Clathrospora elynae TaxID=706981 RepID=A0A6A5SYD1_9PLEO|nr:hypothetical protein EJ02DRAFT_464221 [Clathrospora elynae]
MAYFDYNNPYINGGESDYAADRDDGNYTISNGGPDNLDTVRSEEGAYSAGEDNVNNSYVTSGDEEDYSNEIHRLKTMRTKSARRSNVEEETSVVEDELLEVEDDGTDAVDGFLMETAQYQDYESPSHFNYYAFQAYQLTNNYQSTNTYESANKFESSAAKRFQYPRASAYNPYTSNPTYEPSKPSPPATKLERTLFKPSISARAPEYPTASKYTPCTLNATYNQTKPSLTATKSKGKLIKPSSSARALKYPTMSTYPPYKPEAAYKSKKASLFATKQSVMSIQSTYHPQVVLTNTPSRYPSTAYEHAKARSTMNKARTSLVTGKTAQC